MKQHLKASSQHNEAKLFCRKIPRELFYFDNFRLKYYGKDLSGIESVTVGSDFINADTVVEVYTLSGIQLRGGIAYGEALEGLDRGIYIVRAGNVSLKLAK